MDFESLLGDDDEDIPTEENDEAVTQPTSSIQLTEAKSHPLRTLYLEYTDDLPEYPRSDLNGYTYVIATGGLSQEEAEHLVQGIQYSRASIHGTKKNIKSSFLNCPVKKWVWKCSGALVCEYLKPNLRLLHHTYINDETWLEIQNIRRSIELIEKDISKRNAYSLYRSTKSFFAKQKACLEPLPTCAPQFKRHIYPDINNECHPYVGCVNESPNFLQKYYSRLVKGHTTVDLDFLEQLFNDSVILSQEECGVIKPLTSRRKYCDFDHIQGPGRLEHIKCSVTFTALVLVNIQMTPYVLFTSHGIHQHPPPPPHKPPELILKKIKNILQQMQNPSLTQAQFLQSPELESFCQQHGANTLAEIHASFSNIDRISAIIQKQCLLIYPAGQHFNGVVYLYNTNPFIREYIQEKFYDARQIMIICAFKEQISLLMKLKSFEIDMSYKRVREKGMNEVIFVTYLQSHGKIVILLRIFTNQETTEGYYLLFKRVFSLIERVLGQPVQFNLIHSTGIYGVITDMDSKQYTGLGKYLREIDPLRRLILWQLKGVIIFCRVHFFRSITEAVGNDDRTTGVWSRMAGLIDCKSQDDYDQLCDLLISYEDAKVQSWAEHKKQPVIKAGLNKYCSNIPEYIYDSIRNHTNSAEQSHHKANTAGRRLTLTEAIRDLTNRTFSNILTGLILVSIILIKQQIWRPIIRGIWPVKKRRRSSSAHLSLDSHQSPMEDLVFQRSHSQSQASTSYRSRSSSCGGRQITSRNLSFEQQRQALELKELELRLKKEEEEIWEKQLQNEEKELKLMERRARIQQILD